MGLDDDMDALERKQLGPQHLIAEAWAQPLLRQFSARYGLVTEWEKQQREELRWLRQSLEGDQLPGWLIEMVMDDWRREQFSRRWPLAYDSHRQWIERNTLYGAMNRLRRESGALWDAIREQRPSVAVVVAIGALILSLLTEILNHIHLH